MRRFHLLLAYILFSLCSLAGELKIVTDKGRQGVVNESGEVLVPVIYERLGWSNHVTDIVGESIGYLENGKWGIINIKSGKLSSARYATLEPFSDNLYEAGVTGRFTNIIFKGLIDSQSKVHLDFHYYTIDELDKELWLVSEYDSRKLNYGLFSVKNRLILPAKFSHIEKARNLLIVKNQKNKYKLYSREGVALSSYWLDQISPESDGFLLMNEGYIGQANPDGTIVYPIEYKELNEGGMVSFPEWEIRNIGEDAGIVVKCDSVVYNHSTDLLIAHVNNAEHILAVSEKVFSDRQIQLKYLGKGFIVTQHNISNDWGIYKTDGRLVANQFDTVAIDSSYFYGHNNEGWNIYNFFGRKINDRSFEKIDYSHGKNVPVGKHDFWGWIDFQGERLTSLKYDSLLPGINPAHYIANNYGKWGVRTFADEWLIMPKYEAMSMIEELYIGKKGMAYHVYNTDGVLLHQIPYQVYMGDFLKLSDGERWGLVTQKGKYIYPEYDSIYAIDEYYVLQSNGAVMLIDNQGNTILPLEGNVQRILSFSEGYFHIIKDDQHGFIDLNGKLRIANRYDSARHFSEGYAAIKLRGNWGFVDDQENLIIQPYYSYSSTFSNGLAIIQTDGQYGIINLSGEELVQPTWSFIERLNTGNYRLRDETQKYALANQTGRFILRANFDSLEDSGKGLIVSEQFGKKGVLDYSGLTKIPFEYKDIKINGDYLILRKQ